MINLNKKDRDAGRFFWLWDPTNPSIENNVVVMRYARVIFGFIASPSILNGTVKHHLKQENDPVAELITSNIYVDNVVVAVDSPDEAIEFYKSSKAIFERAGMNLREYVSNSAQFNDSLPAKDRAKGDLNKVLGVTWDTSSDHLRFTAPKSQQNETVTKLIVVSTVSSVFDQLGLLVPVILLAKLFVHKLWLNNLEWDTPLPQMLCEEFKTVLQQLVALADVSVPRYNFSVTLRNQIHVFVDASATSYAAAAYLRSSHSDVHQVQLVFAKSRLPPSSNLTIPRLELLAVLIGIRMMRFLEHELHIAISSWYLWTDSTVCLHWIGSSKPLSVFVENRLHEIRAVNQVTFSHVVTNDNPADFGTRGLSTVELQEQKLWWKGPIWLELNENDWPDIELPTLTPQVLAQVKSEEKGTKNVISLLTQAKSIGTLAEMDLQRFSTLNRLLRTTVFLLRFLVHFVWDRLPLPQPYPWLTELFHKISRRGPVLAEDLEHAWTLSIYQIQHEVFGSIISAIKRNKRHAMSNLDLYLDEKGLIRCQGRLEHADLPFTSKHPVLIPKDHPFTALYIMQVHRRLLHAGESHTLAEIRNVVWIPTGRKAVRKLLQKCAVCKRHLGGPYALPKMAPLPAERVTLSFPFQKTGLDYFGPVSVRQAAETVKMWVCLFTCFLTRAVHLEIAFDLSATHFLSCLRRFIGRRGQPSVIISDNATQFTSVNKALQRTWQLIFQDASVVSYCADRGIDWNFIVEAAPWQGGCYERLVGSVKFCFRKAVGRSLLTVEQLYTILVEIEAILNIRPLNYVSDKQEQLLPLRLIDFLSPLRQIGTPQLQEDHQDPAYNPTLDATDKLIQLWTQSQKLLDHFWELWHKQYLLNQREQHQLHHAGPRVTAHKEPQVDDVVLVQEELVPRGCWKLARITGLIRSHDGEIRAAKIRLANKNHLQRPINKLYPLVLVCQFFATGGNCFRRNQGLISDWRHFVCWGG